MRYPILLILVFLIQPVSAQFNVDSLLQLHFDARGGLQKLRSIESILMKGRATVGKVYGDYTVYVKRPDFIRIDLMAPNTSLFQGFDGNQAWVFAPKNGSTEPEEMTLSEKERLVKEAEIDGPLVDYKQKGYHIEYEGIQQVEGKPTHVLKLLKLNEPTKRYYLDLKSHFSLKESSLRTIKGNSPLATSVVKVETLFDGYTLYDGLYLPKVTTTSMDGNILSILKIQEVQFNTIHDDAVFKAKSVLEGN